MTEFWRQPVDGVQHHAAARAMANQIDRRVGMALFERQNGLGELPGRVVDVAAVDLVARMRP